MRKFLKTAVTAAVLTGAAMLTAAPASAAGFSINVGVPGIGFSYDSGGYCDQWGCPDAFWDYPVYYCPVYFRGDWYKGPVYYRRDRGRTMYWIHGNWRNDQWDRPRPSWACSDRYGPALGFEYYDHHGFRMRDEWRNRWQHDHNNDRGHDRGFNDNRDNMRGHDHGDNGHGHQSGFMGLMQPGGSGGSHEDHSNDHGGSHGSMSGGGMSGGNSGGNGGSHGSSTDSGKSGGKADNKDGHHHHDDDNNSH